MAPTAMTPFRPETAEQAALRQTANRQVLVVGFCTFILGFIAVLLLLGWLIAHFVTPEAPWWDVLHTSFNAILISFVAALGITAGALWLLNQIHYRRGVYPCPYCVRRVFLHARQRHQLAGRGWGMHSRVTKAKLMRCFATAT